MIVVYDLHWCDGPSLRFLAYLVRRLEGPPVLVLGSVRPSERRGDSALLGEIAGDPLTVSIHPGPLSEQAAIRLVRERLGERPTSRSRWRATRSPPAIRSSSTSC